MRCLNLILFTLILAGCTGGFQADKTLSSCNSGFNLQSGVCVKQFDSQWASVRPSSGSGVSANFVFTFTNQAGASAITHAQAFFAPKGAFMAERGCIVRYDDTNNTISLLSNNGATFQGFPDYQGNWGPPVTVGKSAALNVLSNARCEVETSSVFVEKLDDKLILSFDMTFTRFFVGHMDVTAASFANDVTTGWQFIGDWSVPACVTADESVDTLSYFVSEHTDRALSTGPSAANEFNSKVVLRDSPDSGRAFLMKYGPKAWVGYRWDKDFIYFDEDPEGNFGDKPTLSASGHWNDAFSPAQYMKRKMTIGEVFNSWDKKIIYYDNMHNATQHNCVADYSLPYPMKMVIESRIPEYDLGGDIGKVDVIVLRFQQGGDAGLLTTEKEFYAKGWGLVKWQSCDGDGVICLMETTFKYLSPNPPWKLDLSEACTPELKFAFTSNVSTVQPQGEAILSWSGVAAGDFDTCYISGGKWGPGIGTKVPVSGSASTGPLSSSSTKYSFQCHDVDKGLLAPRFLTIDVK